VDSEPRDRIRFEHFLMNEVRAYLAYTGRHAPLSFWRTSQGHEVDLIVGNLDLAIEFKSAKRVRARVGRRRYDAHKDCMAGDESP
jgi:hypothetical protein